MPLSRRPVGRAALVLLGVSALLAGLGLPPSSAVGPAADYGSSVVVHGALPAGFSTGRTNCDADPTVAWVEGPSKPPLGSGSLSVTASSGVGDARVELPVYGVLPQQLGVRASYAVTSPPNTGPLQPDSGYNSIVLVVRTAPTVLTYVSASGGAAQQGWQTLDLWTATIRAVSIDQGTFAQTEEPETAYGLFVAHHLDALVMGGYLGVYCGYQATVAWDDVRIRVGTVETAYDLEPSVAATLAPATAMPATAVAGSAVTVSGAITRAIGGTAVAGAVVELWSRPNGAADFTKLATATSAAGGTLSVSVRPGAATGYRWQLPSSSAFTAPASTAVTVATKPALSLNRVASGVTYPAPVVLFGAMKPGKSGAVVTLRRSGTSTAVVTTTVKSDGTFAFSRKLPRGSYTFWVTVPASTGQGAGTSVKVSVKVS